MPNEMSDLDWFTPDELSDEIAFKHARVVEMISNASRNRFLVTGSRCCFRKVRAVEENCPFFRIETG
jgi:hypothetical protein